MILLAGIKPLTFLDWLRHKEFRIFKDRRSFYELTFNILIRPRKPFFDWLNIVFKDEEPIPEKEENNIYLIREMDSNEDIRNWIKTNFEALFENELNDWYSDESAWPANKTYKMFSEWLEVEVHSMVLDLEDFPLTKDENKFLGEVDVMSNASRDHSPFELSFLKPTNMIEDMKFPVHSF